MSKVNFSIEVFPPKDSVGVEEIYKSLEVDDLILEAYNNREIVKLTFNEEPCIKTDSENKNSDK